MKRWFVLVLIIGLWIPSAAYAQTPTPPTPTPVPCIPGLEDYCEWGVSTYQNHGGGIFTLLSIAGVILLFVFAYISGHLEFWKKEGLSSAGHIKRGFQIKSAARKYLQAVIPFFNTHKFQGTTNAASKDRQEDTVLTLDEVYIDVLLSAPRLQGEESRKDKGNESFTALERAESAKPVNLAEALSKLKKHKMAFLGMAGSGKSTLMQWAGLACARAYLGQKLTAGQKTLLKIFGRKIPLPFFIPLRSYNQYCKKKELTRTPDSLAQFIADYFSERFLLTERELGRDFFAKSFTQPCLLMFDGLDEVDFEDVPQVASALELFITNYENINPNLYAFITARPTPKASDSIAYMMGFEKMQVARLDRNQRNLLIEQWFLRKYKSDPVSARKKPGELIARINSAPDAVRKLATTPLMTTIFCMIGNLKTLPNLRAELYEEIVTTLTQESLFKNDEAGRALEKWGGFSISTRIDVLSHIAFKMQQEGLTSVFEDDLIDWIWKEFDKGNEKEAKQEAHRFLLAVQERGGLLESTGSREYGFLTHDTLREYLAGRLLGEEKEKEWKEILSNYVFSDNWQETIRLTAGYLSSRGKSKADSFIKLIAALGNNEEEKARAIFVAALAMSDTDKDRRVQETVNGLSESAAALISALPVVLENAKMRYDLALALAEVGDPRFVMDKDAKAILPHLIKIDAATFRMGTNEDDENIIKEQGAQSWDDEKPSHSVFLPKYSISKYPVTNAEFQCFMDAGGYDPQAAWWSADGRKWRIGEWESDLSWLPNEDLKKQWKDWLAKRPVEHRNRPFFWEDPRWSAANLPVVGVTWFEAEAYCNWLSEITGHHYRLPTEAQWEHAARGDESRIWAWGNEWDETKANTNDGTESLGGTSPVGMYPHGASAYGAHDMIGNVWEWCLDWYHENEYQERIGKEVKYPCREEGGTVRVLRGGSWDNYRDVARCSYRDGSGPVLFSNILGFRVVLLPIMPLHSATLSSESLNRENQS